MVPRIALATVVLAALTYGLALHAQDTTAPKTEDAAQIRENLVHKEQILARQYQEFEQQLLRLKQRLERSSKQEDRDKALVLDKVLDYCKDKSISVSFEQMIDTLKSKELKSVPDIETALNRSKNIAEDLQKVIFMLREDSRARILSEERLRLQAIMKELEKVIQDQKSVQAQTENKKTEPTELKKNQESVNEKTHDIALKLGGDKGAGKDGKNSKGDPKAGGKASDKAGEAKDDGEKAAAKSEAKEAGEGKEPKAVAKSGEPGKEGQPKEGKTPEGAKAKEGGKSGEAAKGEPKEGAGKPGEGKGKPGQAKAGGKSDSQAKGDGKKGPDSPPPQASNKGDGGKKNPNQQAAAPKESIPNGKKQVEDAEKAMQQATDEIQKAKNDDAVAKQEDALKKLEEARKKLEQLLRQIREEELERLLSALQARCEKMLAMQIQVLVATENLDKAIAAQPDKLPDRTNKQDSLKLSDNEGDIVVEASKALEILQDEGSAVAFPEVFQQVREDMKHVQRRLGISDTAQVTQSIERDIVDTLKEMIEALKKAKKDLAESKSSPPPPSGPPPEQKLLEKIAELKMIRSMQIRVNTRTQTYGRMYQGEQSGDPNIRRELHNLSERQERIFEVTNRMAKGDNR